MERFNLSSDAYSAAILLSAVVAIPACGKAIPFQAESALGPSVVEGTGEVRQDGTSLGFIYSVTQIVEAPTGPIADWVASDMPFTGTAVTIGQPVVDGQTQFAFSLTYPPNNYQLAEAHLVIDTSRDTSDTEGILVDGIFSGRPPLASVNSSTPKVTERIYYGSSAPTPNTYYIDWSLSHYKQNTRNTFDLNLQDLLAQSTKTPVSILSDGYLPVVTGDDSPVYQAYLVMKGYTISKTALSCTLSPTYTFQNTFLFNDGNSIGSPFFAGSVLSPTTSWTTARGSFQSVEFYYDPQLPKVDLPNLTITSGLLNLRLKRSATGTAALVVNGVGIAQAGFDRAQATAEVESWEEDPATVAKWEAFVNSIPATEADTSKSLNLVDLLGATRLKNLIAQGKLNFSIAGSVAVVYAERASSFRGFTSTVAGPELVLQGNYFTQLCTIPDDPGSPLQDGAPLPANVGDDTSPVLNSIQASEITSSSAVIQWLSDEGSSSQVHYGVGSTDTSTADDVTMTTFHRVELNGLLPYKYYYFQVRSADSNGNVTTSGIKTFRTLR